jgi:crotonobetainyl-CoA:carnitine CoA-transferase CaiB-like acyl-CoA transferase
LVRQLVELTRRTRGAELLSKLEDAGIPAGPINDLDQVFSDPQVLHRGMRLELADESAKGGTIPGVRTPLVIGGRPMAAEHASPRLGEHTIEILTEIGEDEGHGPRIADRA